MLLLSSAGSAPVVSPEYQNYNVDGGRKHTGKNQRQFKVLFSTSFSQVHNKY